MGYDYYIGKVVYSVPVLGRVLAFFVTFHGKIAAGSLIGLAILLQIIGGVLDSADEKKQAKKETGKKYRRNSFAMSAENSIITVAVKDETVTEKRR